MQNHLVSTDADRMLPARESVRRDRCRAGGPFKRGNYNAAARAFLLFDLEQFKWGYPRLLWSSF